jgi:hypothetical protein
MREINIGPVHSFGDPDRKVIDSEGVKVGVFKLDDELWHLATRSCGIKAPAPRTRLALAEC